MLITSLYTALTAVLLIVLSFNIAAKRYRLKTGLGDKGDKILQIAIRAQGNLIEYAPITLLLLLFVEMGHQLPSDWVHGLGMAFVISRIAHAFGFIKGRGGVSICRMVGTLVNWLIILALAIFILVVHFS